MWQTKLYYMVSGMFFVDIYIQIRYISTPSPIPTPEIRAISALFDLLTGLVLIYATYSLKET